MLKFIIYIIIFLICLGKNVFSQTAFSDSLKLALKAAEQDTSRCIILNALVVAEADDKIWPAYNDRLKTIAETNSKTSKGTLHAFYLKYLAMALNNLGYLSSQHSEMQQAAEYYLKALKIQEEINEKN